MPIKRIEVEQPIVVSIGAQDDNEAENEKRAISNFRHSDPAWYKEFCKEWNEARFRILKEIERERKAKEKIRGVAESGTTASK